VYEVCNIWCNISTQFQSLPVYKVRGSQTWREILFEIEMKAHGTNTLEFTAYFDGQPQRGVKVTQPYSGDPPPS